MTEIGSERPSRTAWRVALRRAAHQVLDTPPVLADPLALAVVGADAATPRADPRERGSAARTLRAFLVVRSRFAEDSLAAAVASGVRQYVVLGAGLDTFAYRNPHADLRVFEVDRPSTQRWKRERLRAAGIAVPPTMAFAPVDFERETAAEGLARVGFRADQPAFVSWLGVVPYLTHDSVMAVLRWVASLPAPSGIVFDYGLAASSLSLLERLALSRLSARVAAAGEPFRTLYAPASLHAALRDAGFSALEELDRAALNRRYFSGRLDGLEIRGGLGRLVHARVGVRE